MKSVVALALSFCPCVFLAASDAQTTPKKNQPLPYSDSDGYKVLSSIIDTRSEKLKGGSLLIFHQTVSGGAFREIRVQCSSGFPGEFHGALSCGTASHPGMGTSPVSSLTRSWRASQHFNYVCVPRVAPSQSDPLPFQWPSLSLA